jgi:hypothetical protein
MFARLQDSTTEMTKVAKLLMLIDRGEIGNFAGKTLDEIDTDGNYAFVCFIKCMNYISVSNVCI